jgi:hypothetical protein
VLFAGGVIVRFVVVIIVGFGGFVDGSVDNGGFVVIGFVVVDAGSVVIIGEFDGFDDGSGVGFVVIGFVGVVDAGSVVIIGEFDEFDDAGGFVVGFVDASFDVVTTEPTGLITGLTIAGVI